jgi:hypothetical protein
VEFPLHRCAWARRKKKGVKFKDAILVASRRLSAWRPDEETDRYDQCAASRTYSPLLPRGLSVVTSAHQTPIMLDHGVKQHLRAGGALFETC